MQYALPAVDKQDLEVIKEAWEAHGESQASDKGEAPQGDKAA